MESADRKNVVRPATAGRFYTGFMPTLRFYFLDEPVSHLDDGNARIMGQILTEEAQRQGMGVIVTSIGKHLPLEYAKVFSL